MFRLSDVYFKAVSIMGDLIPVRHLILCFPSLLCNGIHIRLQIR